MENEAEKPVSDEVKNEAQAAESTANAKSKLSKEEAISLRAAAAKVRQSADGLEVLTQDLVDPKIADELTDDEKAKKEKRAEQLREAKATFNAKLAEKLARIDALEAEKLAAASKNNELATELAALKAASALESAKIGQLKAELRAAEWASATRDSEAKDAADKLIDKQRELEAALAKVAAAKSLPMAMIVVAVVMGALGFGLSLLL